MKTETNDLLGEMKQAWADSGTVELVKYFKVTLPFLQTFASLTDSTKLTNKE